MFDWVSVSANGSEDRWFAVNFCHDREGCRRSSCFRRSWHAPAREANASGFAIRYLHASRPMDPIRPPPVRRFGRNQLLIKLQDRFGDFGGAVDRLLVVIRHHMTAQPLTMSARTVAANRATRRGNAATCALPRSTLPGHLENHALIGTSHSLVDQNAEYQQQCQNPASSRPGSLQPAGGHSLCASRTWPFRLWNFVRCSHALTSIARHDGLRSQSMGNCAAARFMAQRMAYFIAAPSRSVPAEG